MTLKLGIQHQVLKYNQRLSYALASFVPMIDLDEIYVQDT